MINYVDRIADLIAPQVEGLEKEEIRSMIETPADSKMGDYAFPCFKLAKILRKAPPMIAKGIAEAIGDDAMFEKVEQVNAYVNMFLKKDAFAKEGLFVKSIEGKNGSGWVLMDFGDVIVNLFTKEMRDKYSIEKVWGDCQFIEVEE